MNQKIYDRLLQYSFWLLARKRYTRSELQKKLEGHVTKKIKEGKFADLKATHMAVEEVIKRLDTLKYVDDVEFVKDYVRQRLRCKPRGKYLLERELCNKGISKDLFQEVIEDVEVNEEEVAEDCLKIKMKRWGRLPEQKQKEKAFRFLSSRGFALDAIYKAVECCYNRSVN